MQCQWSWENGAGNWGPTFSPALAQAMLFLTLLVPLMWSGHQTNPLFTPFFSLTLLLC